MGLFVVSGTSLWRRRQRCWMSGAPLCAHMTWLWSRPLCALVSSCPLSSPLVWRTEDTSMFFVLLSFLPSKVIVKSLFFYKCVISTAIKNPEIKNSNGCLFKVIKLSLTSSKPVLQNQIKILFKWANVYFLFIDCGLMNSSHCGTRVKTAHHGKW